MDEATFDRFCELIYSRSGIALTKRKKALLEGRVARRVRALSLPDVGVYLAYVQDDANEAERVNLVDAISTNVTDFFREPAHFEFVRDVCLSWRRAGRQRLRFWCAGCATGEEPFSLAMTLLETGEISHADVRILACDISTAALRRSRDGVYPASKLKDIPGTFRRRYFESLADDGADHYRVVPAVRRLVVFKHMDLSKTPYPMRGPFDAVFCRNVMIYFDGAVKARMLTEMGRLIRPGGYLLVGHAESLIGRDVDFLAAAPSIYARRSRDRPARRRRGSA